ncbi:MAG TPA: serine/threonine-protein kinase [Myxococcales bacterium]|nr:serine/threonine-protein kinase [Myxococcales bacterium]
MGECLDRETLERVAVGRLGEPALSAARAHLEGCGRCAAALAELLDLQTGPTRAVGALDDATRDLHGKVPLDPGVVSGPNPVVEKIGPYVLLERLGEGGMGAVYVAYHPELDRKVAVKLLRAEHESSEGAADWQARLLREAQAMARLDHPNVVAVHDAGQYQAKVYLVMDRVEGATLREWLAERDRGWREILSVFVQAGRGLAAAHAVGLVHRDFKPSNVLVGRDGRARVTDFGVARAVGQAPDPGLPSNASEDPPGPSLAAPITRAGTVMGTPRYMAPEQAMGGTGDPRSDQFSFCVALYEALFGVRPFHGNLELEKRPQLREPRKGRDVPRFVKQAIVRGLSTEPAERFPTMDGLLAALSRSPVRRAALGLGAAAAAAAIVALVGLLRARGPPAIAGCDDASQLGGVWNGDAREAVRARLGASSAALVRALDAYAADWTRSQEAACHEAERTRGDEATLSRLTCLGRQRLDFRALVEALSHADRGSAAGAGDALAGLLPPARCADPHVLAELPRLPTDPHVRAEVEGLRLDLSRAAVEAVTGKPKEASEEAGVIAMRARALRYRPLEAKALYVQGLAQRTVGDQAASDRSLLDAENAAEAGGADLTAAQAAALLALNGCYGGRPADAEQWLARARACLERVGGDGYTEGLVEGSAAALAEVQGQDQAAIDHAQRAYRLLDQALGPNHPQTLAALTKLGVAYDNIGRFEEARDRLREALDQTDQVLGPGAKDGTLLPPLAESCAWTGHFDEAEAAVRRGQALVGTAVAPSGGWSGELTYDLALVRYGQGRMAEALPLARTALAIHTKALGARSILCAQDLALVGDILEASGKAALAEPVLRRAIATYEQGGSGATVFPADPLQHLAAALTALGRPKEALPLLDRAQELLARHQPSAGELAAVRFTLAKALVASGGDPDRAAELARQAREELSQLPWKARQLTEVDAWLKARVAARVARSR